MILYLVAPLTNSPEHKLSGEQFKSYLFANELEHVTFCVINSAGLLDKTNLSLPISLSICQYLSFISDRMGNEL